MILVQQGDISRCDIGASVLVQGVEPMSGLYNAGWHWLG